MRSLAVRTIFRPFSPIFIANPFLIIMPLWHPSHMVTASLILSDVVALDQGVFQQEHCVPELFFLFCQLLLSGRAAVFMGILQCYRFDRRERSDCIRRHFLHYTPCFVTDVWVCRCVDKCRVLQVASLVHQHHFTSSRIFSLSLQCLSQNW